MRGLLLKDLYNLSGQLKIYLLYPCLAAFLAYQQGSLSVVALSCSFITMFVIISACAYDEMANFDSYALTLPLTRKDIVLSKYQLTTIVSLINATIVILVSALLQTFFPAHFEAFDWQLLLLEVLLITVAINTVICLFLPMIFRFGTEKARILLMVVFIGFSAGIYLIASIDFSWVQQEHIQFLEDFGIYIVAIVAIVVEWLSIWISNHIMMKKEL